MTIPHASLLAGLLIGFSVAVPVGPIGLLCIQRTLSSGPRIGISTGLGAATMNVVYGTAILLGFGRATEAPGGAEAMGAVGVMVLLWSAARAWGRARTRPAELDGATPMRSALMAYASAVLFSATSPVGPMVLAALLMPVVRAAMPSTAEGLLLLLGIFAAASTWWVCLSLLVGALQGRLGPCAIAMLNRVAGVLLFAYALLAAGRMAGW